MLGAWKSLTETRQSHAQLKLFSGSHNYRMQIRATNKVYHLAGRRHTRCQKTNLGAHLIRQMWWERSGFHLPLSLCVRHSIINVSPLSYSPLAKPLSFRRHLPTFSWLRRKTQTLNHLMWQYSSYKLNSRRDTLPYIFENCSHFWKMASLDCHKFAFGQAANGWQLEKMYRWIWNCKYTSVCICLCTFLFPSFSGKLLQSFFMKHLRIGLGSNPFKLLCGPFKATCDMVKV